MLARMDIVAPDEHQLLVLCVQLVMFLFLASSLGEVMRRIGQPSVIGELGGGLLIGAVQHAASVDVMCRR